MKQRFKKFFPALLFLTGTTVTGLSIGSGLKWNTATNEVIQKIQQCLEKINKEYPQDRVYLHLDKPFYKPGENIWFRAYVRNAQTFKESSQSDILHVELINPKGTVDKHLEIIAQKGLASGDFHLPENVAGGLYKIKAYTNWQKNEASVALFEKEIQVQSVVLPSLKMKLDFDKKAFGKGDFVTATAEFITLENKKLASKTINYVVQLDGGNFLQEKVTTDADGKAYISFKLPQDLTTNDGLLNLMVEHEGKNESISRSVPIVLGNIEFSLFPEGGDMVSGISTTVAFRALNEFGKPADVEGFITDSKGNKITEFSSFHMGMGAFKITPANGETYYANITKPANIKKKYELPEALSKGYVLNVAEVSKNEITLNVTASHSENLILVATVRDKLCYTGQISPTFGNNKVRITTEQFPIGIARFTLFDSRGIERAERLAFVNKHKQLQLKIETDKEKYLPREKVKMTIKVTDENGIAMPGNFSVSVADDKLLSFADDRSGNIVSKFLLESDIKEKVEEPAFYFNTEEAKADEALNYLLMTSGWRRFTWKQILDQELPPLTYQPEKAVISGTITDGYTGKIVPKAKVEVLNKNIYTIADENGHYSLRGVDLYEPVNLFVSASGYSNQNYYVNAYNSNFNMAIYNYSTYYDKYDMTPTVAGHNKGAGGGNFPRANNVKRAIKEEALMEDADLLKAAPMELGMEVEMTPEELAANDLVDNNEDEDIAGEVVEQVKDMRFDDEIDFHEKKKIAKPIAPAASKYFRARQFAAPVYDSQEPVSVRTDFRSTIYWNGNVETDRTGKAVVEFYNSDEVTSFRIITEGLSADGTIGRAEKVYFTQLPFSMTVKCPVELTTGDIVSIPLTFKNNTSKSISGELKLDLPEGLKTIKSVPSIMNVEALQAKTLMIQCEVLQAPGTTNLGASFKSSGFSDAFTQEIAITSKGFPVNISLSGNSKEKEYEFIISHLVDGSMNASFTAYPSVMTDLLKGIESIVREPYGCFEQTSTSNYPNVLVKLYLMEMEDEAQGANRRFKAPAQLEANLDKGYKRLVSYETKEKGYEWFGGTPAHEALTAYGLMQFNDMKKVYNDVDQLMIDRTANWLMSRKDGNGGFKRSGQALDEFGRATEEITNAYIVYALSEGGYTDIMKEAEKSFDKAMSSKDPYQLALVANTMYNLKDLNKADRAMKLLTSLQEANGSWTGTLHSITCSQGNSLTIETTSLALMAMIKSSNADHGKLTKAVEYIVSSRSGYGGFGSTQGTVLALKALTKYAVFSKKTSEGGTIELYADGKKIAEKVYEAGQNGVITIVNLNSYFSEGKHRVKVKFIGVKEALPYSMAINYNTSLPNSSKDCKVSLTTEMKAASVHAGETARLTSVIKNTTSDGLPMTMGIIGIPAGMTSQPWQLKELQEKKMVDFYEVRGNNVFLYFRQMKPNEAKTIHLDLKAEIPGNFEAPASSAYLYYTSEFKSWSKPEKIEIKN